MQDINAKPERRALVRSAALEGLSKRFRAALLRYFRRRVNDEAEAERLVQEVLLRMLRRGGVTTLEDARGYLFETASSVLIDRARRLNGRYPEEQEAVARKRIRPGLEPVCGASTALLELPERTRTIFVLRRLEGMKYAQIARLLGISVSAVEKQMARTLSHLTTRVNDP
jgi:RNA polymerase sigma-70 factor (ECF subfamily)